MVVIFIKLAPLPRRRHGASFQDDLVVERMLQLPVNSLWF
jgi:hypothetical protein